MALSTRRRYLLGETGIGSVMNAVMALLATFVAGGRTIVVPDRPSICLQTFMAGFMTVLIATLLTRRRRRRNRCFEGRRIRGGIVRYVPQNAVVRALLVGVLCLATLGSALLVALPLFAAIKPGVPDILLAVAGSALIQSLLVAPPALVLAMDEDLPIPSSLRPAPSGSSDCKCARVDVAERSKSGRL